MSKEYSMDAQFLYEIYHCGARATKRISVVDKNEWNPLTTVQLLIQLACQTFYHLGPFPPKSHIFHMLVEELGITYVDYYDMTLEDFSKRCQNKAEELLKKYPQLKP